ncbi:MAG TPA: OmpA family protein [Steroidobacteraceae bacterium]|jgi:OmpA-OmpF porin, OOP family|nr:OmpA family protein [Steroidobacteraceae bacterium]
MKSNNRVVVSLAVAAVLSACSTAAPRNESLETARTMIPQVEQSPRAGVAAVDIANARSSLEAANRLAAAKGKQSDVEFEAGNAVLSAQIANEKILTAQANDEIAAGTAQRQTVLLQARERETQQSAQQAGDARRAADAAEVRADSLETQLADLKVKKTERGLVLTLGDVLFDTNQATLKSGAYGTLDRLAMALREQSGRKVLIEGHTDNVGADESNQELSQRRAQSVQTALTQRGVARDQITAIGKGETFPVASNDDAAGRQANRRVELIFSEDQPRVAADQP